MKSTLLAVAVVLLLTARADGRQIHFEDATPASGLPAVSQAHGVSVFDYNLDGMDDLLITSTDGPVRLFSGNGDATFVEKTSAAGVDVSGNYAAAVFADFNIDGWPDLFIGGRVGGSVLLAGTSSASFEVVDSSGIDNAAEVGSVTAGDFNADGGIDLFIATRNAGDLLYQSRSAVLTKTGEAWFADVSAAMNVEGDEESVAMQSTWIDYDRDGDLDLFKVHEETYPNILYANSGGQPMLDVGSDAGISSTGDGNGMGAVWSDYNNDGWFDAYITRDGAAGFFESNGDGTFSNIAASSGAESMGMSWGAVFADFDLDGDEDLFVGSTYGFDGTPTQLFENRKGRFVEVAADAGALFNLDAFGVARGDFNNDGKPDLFVTDNGGNSKLLINSSPVSYNWLTVRLEGVTTNFNGIGATVELAVSSTRLRRMISAGDSYCSQSAPVAHFGLKNFAAADSLIIHWKTGAREVLSAVNANQHLVVKQTAGTSAVEPVKDFHGDGVISHYPEPASDHITINAEGLNSSTTGRFVIIDMLGRTVLEEPLELRNVRVASHVVDTSTLPAGVYYYVVLANGDRVGRPLTIVR